MIVGMNDWRPIDAGSQSVVTVGGDVDAADDDDDDDDDDGDGDGDDDEER